MNPIHRRRFIKLSAVAAGASLAPPLVRTAWSQPAAAAAGPKRRILIAPGSPLPVRTAANELSQHTGAPVVERAHDGAVGADEIVLVLGDALRQYREAAAKLPPENAAGEWELVLETNGGLVIAGRDARNVCRAALGWIANPARETNRLSAYELDERFTCWDNTMNHMCRFSKGFDRRVHFREIARLGFTGVEINRYADAGYHVLHRKFPMDSYAWFMSYGPALDAFVEGPLTRGFYDPRELKANLDDLREAAQLAREFGLKPGFVCYEPRGVNEAIFDKYPELRGSRVDHPGRSLQPRYNLDIANPRVLEHYAESMALLMKEVPDLRYFNFWTQDSGSGMPFARRLYAGPNGSHLARMKSLGEHVHNFAKALLDAGRRVNPELEVILQTRNVGPHYTDAERSEIVRALPPGATVSFLVRSSSPTAGDHREVEYVADDRAAGIEPYVGMVTFSGHRKQEPIIIGAQTPQRLLATWRRFRASKLRRFMAMGGIICPTQSAYNVNQELFAELIRGETPDLGAFMEDLATQWCDGDTVSARALVEAWNAGNDAIDAWPQIRMYNGAAGRTEARWIIRPLVPDITKLDASERVAWERSLFPLPWDLARLNISFEGGVRYFVDEELLRVVKASDEKVIPLLTKAVAILDQAYSESGMEVLEDQRDRYRGLLLCMKTERNLFEAQVATNDYLLKKGDPAANRARVRAAIAAEIENTQDWIRALTESRTNFFRIAEKEETPFVYLTPLEDLKLKLEVMPRHIDDEPGPFLKELLEPRRPPLAFT